MSRVAVLTETLGSITRQPLSLRLSVCLCSSLAILSYFNVPATVRRPLCHKTRRCHRDRLIASCRISDTWKTQTEVRHSVHLFSSLLSQPWVTLKSRAHWRRIRSRQKVAVDFLSTSTSTPVCTKLSNASD